MKDPDDDLRQTVALFRYGVIADLVHLPVGTPGRYSLARHAAMPQHRLLMNLHVTRTE